MEHVLEETTPVGRMRLQVRQRRFVAEEVVTFELVSPDGSALPAFSAGAHIDVKVPCGRVRSYSLCSDPMSNDHYAIAVKRQAEGKGGSTSMVDDLQVGDVIWTSLPKNDFALTEGSERYLFIAGGIGITPILSMIRRLERYQPSSYQLLYLTATPEQTPFLEELKKERLSGEILIHHSKQPLSARLDIGGFLEQQNGREIYCCGSDSLMRSVRMASRHWSEQSVHFESFGSTRSGEVAGGAAFEVHFARSNTTLVVEPHETILTAAINAGIAIDSSCRGGSCGTCAVPLLTGQVDHRDFYLSVDAQKTRIITCVSRGKGSIAIDA
ncbi:PDR/VanB family oxidoreductase [Mesorhizobium sp. SB112]|uniref:PDR/VanB family oxidoreductase n=1 Tax=Mesorhizobium sp. SB112 TaxID=3151853 RepID=UPI003267BDEE